MENENKNSWELDFDGLTPNPSPLPEEELPIVSTHSAEETNIGQVTVYYASNLKSDDFRKASNTKDFTRYLEDFERQHQYTFDRKAASSTFTLKNIINNETPGLHGYVYTATIDIDESYINANEILPPQYQERFLDMIQLEDPTVSTETLQSAISKVSFSIAKGHIEDKIGEERLTIMLHKIGIKGYYTDDAFTVLFEDNLPKVTPRRVVTANSITNNVQLDVALDRGPKSFLTEMFDPARYGFNQGYILALQENKDDFLSRIFDEITKRHPHYSAERFEADLTQQLRKTFYDVSNTPDNKGIKKSSSTANLPTTYNELSRFLGNIENLGGYNNCTYKATYMGKGEIETIVVKDFHSTTKKAAAKSEYEAYQIYQAFGVKTPKVNFLEDGNRTTLVMEYIDGPVLDEILKSDEYNIFSEDKLHKVRDAVNEDFVIDALLGNFDNIHFHYGNIMCKQNTGEFYRIDPGSALDFSFNGKLKEEAGSRALNSWDESITDFFTFRTHSFNALYMFAGLKNDEILSRLHQATSCLPEVKKVASEKNYAIIEARLKSATKHFEKLCDLERSFADNLKDVTQKADISEKKVTRPQKPTSKQSLKL